MFLLKSSKVNIAGAFLLIMFMLIGPQQVYSEQVNGEYTIEFNILHADQKNASIAEGYWDQPATVYIEDDRIRVETSINKHAWVTEFATSFNGNMSEVKTISVDEAANVRVTEFEIANFTDLVESNVSVSIDEINYDHSYTMYFKFKPETLTLVKAAEQPDDPVQAERPPETTPDLAPDSTEDTDSAKPNDPVANEEEDPSDSDVVDVVDVADPEPADPEPANGQPELESPDLVEEPMDSDVDDETDDASHEKKEEAIEEPIEQADDVVDDTEPNVEEDEEADSVLAPDSSDETNEPVEDEEQDRTWQIVATIMFVLIGVVAIVIFRVRHKN